MSFSIILCLSANVTVNLAKYIIFKQLIKHLSAIR